ncbi:MAG TPA: EAL domain-containing protein [Xanthobacteraceae bacterium]|jgi:cyclic-di-GMP phosphodiesterase TipF (flagellum assembly factor)|nr:EAL domain-containing protein [Xanthobacteraceae bacterium]
MVRLSAVFIAVCMVLIAGSLGATLYLSFGLSRIEAAVIAVAVLTGLALFNAISTRARDRSDIGDQIADLSRGTADLARQVAEIGRRLATVEGEVTTATNKTRMITQPLTTEIEVLGTLVKQLAESVATHENALIGGKGLSAPTQPIASMRGVATEAAKSIDRTELGEIDPNSNVIVTGRFRGMDQKDAIAVIRRTLEANRIDMHLQPIVTLPQRKVRYYEAMTRLRTEEGELLLPDDYLSYAESGGLMPMIDNLLLFRCVQVLRRLLAKNRDVGLFCNLAGDTLQDSEFFPQFSDFMQANRALAPSLVFEISQATVRSMGPIEQESLAALSQLGFRFSMDHVTDLRIEPRDLAERGFRFIKVPAQLLLSRGGPSASDIHPADFSDLLGRFGIDLIAEKVESEGVVVDLLDFDVRFGQGFLFSPPRPVRAEVLQGTSDTPNAPTRREASRPGDTGDSAPAETREAAAGALSGQRPSSDARTSGLAQLARASVRRA